MNTALNSNYNLTLKVLSPVHVGAGTEKNWQRGIDFVEADGHIYVLQQNKLFEAMSEQLQRDYTHRMGDANFREAEKLIIEHIDLDAVSSPVFEYDGGKLNNEIKTVTRNGMGRAYIPGSSLKGAMISAIFHYLHYQAGPTKHNRFINNDLLGTFAQSIMRYIRPGDTAELKTEVTNVSLFNLFQKGSDWKSEYKDGFKISMEHFKAGAKGQFRLSVADGFGGEVKAWGEKIHRPLLPKYYDRIVKGEDPLPYLFKLVNDYSFEHLRRERQFFEQYDQAPDTDLIIEEIDRLQARIQAAGTQSCVLRMAAGSGFHGITGDWRFRNHLSTIQQPDPENQTWSQRNRRREPSRYKSRKIMSNGDELLLGFVEIGVV
jgi:hypothetical protein